MERGTVCFISLLPEGRSGGDGISGVSWWMWQASIQLSYHAGHRRQKLQFRWWPLRGARAEGAVGERGRREANLAGLKALVRILTWVSSPARVQLRPGGSTQLAGCCKGINTLGRPAGSVTQASSLAATSLRAPFLISMLWKLVLLSHVCFTHSPSQSVHFHHSVF